MISNERLNKALHRQLHQIINTKRVIDILSPLLLVQFIVPCEMWLWFESVISKCIIVITLISIVIAFRWKALDSNNDEPILA